MPEAAAAPSAADVLELRHVTKAYGRAVVVDDVSFSLRRGEFAALLGPSGAGKTTVLRLIAGLETPTAGGMVLAGERLDDKPPYERDVTTVFQHYALFPHMDVFDNTAFGLRCRRRLSGGEIAGRVDEALGLVQLRGYERRAVRGLSGGEQQRVALARAIVTKPALLLLDEPLGALDPQLRRQTCAELRELHRRLGITFLYVTHDQEEALSMSDRVIVIQQGKTQQSGSPEDLFWHPHTRFVAQFIGEANILSGAPIGREDGNLRLALGGGLSCLVAVPEAARSFGPEAVEFAVRGERIVLGPQAARCPNRFSGPVLETRFYGSLTEIVLALGDSHTLRVRTVEGGRHGPCRIGETVTFGWGAEDAVILHG